MEGPSRENGWAMAAISGTLTERLHQEPARAGRGQAIGVWSCFAAIVGVSALSVALALAASSTSGGDWGFSLLVIPIAITSAGLGVLVQLRRSDNVVGWLLLANGLTLASLALAWPYAYYGGVSHPGSLPGVGWAALWSEAGWPGLYVFLMAIAFVFPDGRLPSPRWRWVAIATVATYVGLELGFAFHPGSFDAPFEQLSKPLPSYPSSLEWIWVPFYVGVLASLFAAFFAVRSRLRHASGVERLQILWFTYAAMLIPVALVANILTGPLNGAATDVVAGLAVFAMLIAIPTAVAIGILRYRLFDIELAVNRTLVYGSLTLAIVIAYVAIVSALGTLISHSGIAGVLAAGLVAAGVQPLRMRLQRRADRWVYGDRSDPYAALTRLGDRLQETLAPDQVVQTVVDSVFEALRLQYAAVEFDRDGGIETVAAQGAARAGTLRRLPLIYNGETIANLVVEEPSRRRLTAPDERLLADLAQHAGPAVHAVRLNADLQRSRERLVAAREEERRRLRRDLHDGLGPTLAGMALQLDAARNRSGDPGVDEILASLRVETQDAIADVRRVVEELRPPALDELGLVGALRGQAERLAGAGGRGTDRLVVDVEAPEALPPLPAAVEVAAYRIATEALTNVVRHAGAGRCVVRLAVGSQLELELEVVDDGRGIGAEPPGVGLSSMRERAAELGGSCTIGAARGGGTAVRAALPAGNHE
jgi:signal transduction histidine kinase